MAEKKVLIERAKNVNPLQYTETVDTETGGKRLGHLAGIGADLNNATRNGRKYPIDLWRKVEESDDFKEMMETHTCFAETDHPSEESGRIDTSLKEVAAVLTKFEIREDEGIVWVELDILDTPQGRIAKSLVDYGCVLGVSSRGLGEEIIRDGETIIDPETYSFYGFDLVVQPAVKSARQTATESVNKKASNVVESFKREIANAKSNDEVEAIRRIAENTNIPNMDLINEAIDNKLNSSSNEEDNIYIEKLEQKVNEILAENQKLKTMLKNVSKSAIANDIRVKETNSKLEQTTNAMQGFKTRLVDQNTQLENLKREKVRNEYAMAENEKKIKNESKRVVSALNTNEQNEKKLESVLGRNEKLNNKIKSLERALEQNKISYNSNLNKIQSDNDRLQEKLDKQLLINENLRNKCTKYESQLRESIDELKETEDELKYAKKLIQEKNSKINDITKKSQLNESKIRNTKENEVKQIKENLSNVIEKYLQNKCLNEGIDEKMLKSSLPKNYTIEDIDKKVSEIVERRRKFNNFPIALGEIKTGTVNLSESMKASPEDLQTLTLLTGFQK